MFFFLNELYLVGIGVVSHFKQILLSSRCCDRPRVTARGGGPTLPTAVLKAMRSDAASLVKRAKAAGVLSHEQDRQTMYREARRGRGRERVNVFVIG